MVLCRIEPCMHSKEGLVIIEVQFKWSYAGDHNRAMHALQRGSGHIEVQFKWSYAGGIIIEPCMHSKEGRGPVHTSPECL